MISEKEQFLVLMAMCEVSNKKQELLLEELQDFSFDAILREKQVFSEEEFARLQAFDPSTLQPSIENMLRSGLQIVTIFSPNYPKSLQNLDDRPLILFAKGDLSLLDKRCFAVVGTRMPSGYGKLTTERFSKALAESGLVIVSGLCYGTDAIAHRACLDAGGKTVAIIASGFGHIYPAPNANLAKEIVEKGGLILSEYPPSFQAKKYTFPRRNRIVAGVSDGILIPEAGIKSGTLHTKEYALEYGKDVFAIPGNINSPKSELTNFLIKSSQAVCVTEPEDILRFYGISQEKLQQEKQAARAVTLSFDEQTIVALLQNGQQSYDFLAQHSALPIGVLNSCLTTLEISGVIRKLPAQIFCLT